MIETLSYRIKRKAVEAYCTAYFLAQECTPEIIATMAAVNSLQYSYCDEAGIKEGLAFIKKEEYSLQETSQDMGEALGARLARIMARSPEEEEDER